MLKSNPVVRTGGSLGVVLALMVGLSVATKKIAGKSGSLAAAFGPGGRSPAGLLSVLGRYPIARGQTLILLKLDRRVLLLSQTAGRLRGSTGSLTTLCEIAEPEDVASILLRVQEAEGDSTADRFRTLLERYDRDYGDTRDSGIVNVPAQGRQVATSDEGDQVELWDDAAPPPADRPEHAVPEPIKLSEHVPLAMSLRDRLVGVGKRSNQTSTWGRA